MTEQVENIMASFLKKIDAKLDSVLAVNARLMKENIELRKKVQYKSRSPSPENIKNFKAAPQGGKLKLIAENIAGSDDIRFTGRGTYDAKEKIKTFGNARYEAETKSWILTPQKVPKIKLEFIQSELSKDFDFQMVLG